MLKNGIFFAPSMFEAGFISSSHTKKDIDYTVKRAFKSNLKPTLIHFEELNRASQHVRNAALQILLRTIK